MAGRSPRSSIHRGRRASTSPRPAAEGGGGGDGELERRESNATKFYTLVRQVQKEAREDRERERAKREAAERYNFHVNGKHLRFARRACYMPFLVDTNPIRVFLVTLVTHRFFEAFVLTMIVANSIVLALSNYNAVRYEDGSLDPKDPLNRAVEESELPFTLIFLVEMLLKMAAMGVVMEEGSYLRDSWNVLDFVVVLAGVVGIFPGIPNISAFRTVRVLRPLRSLNAVPGMRLLVQSLLRSIPPLMNVVALLSFVFVIFGILGLQLWNGVLTYRCRLTEYPVRINPNWGGSFGVDPLGPNRECKLPTSPACLELFIPAGTSYFNEFVDQTTALEALEDLNATTVSENRFITLLNDSEAVAVETPYKAKFNNELGMYIADIVNGSALAPCLTKDNSDKSLRSDDADWRQSTSPWETPKDCFWPSDVAESRVCDANDGGEYFCPSGRWCGSDYDQFGNPRFHGRLVMQAAIFISDRNFGFTTFDNIFVSFVTIFQCITMEGWVDIMYMVKDAFNGPVAAIYFVILIVVGSFFLLNLTLAVIWESFSTGQKELEEEQRAAAEEIARKRRRADADALHEADMEAERLASLESSKSPRENLHGGEGGDDAGAGVRGRGWKVVSASSGKIRERSASHDEGKPASVGDSDDADGNDQAHVLEGLSMDALGGPVSPDVASSHKGGHGGEEAKTPDRLDTTGRTNQSATTPSAVMHTVVDDGGKGGKRANAGASGGGDGGDDGDDAESVHEYGLGGDSAVSGMGGVDDDDDDEIFVAPSMARKGKVNSITTDVGDCGTSDSMEPYPASFIRRMVIVEQIPNWRIGAFYVANNPWFAPTVLFLIVLNTIILAMDRYPLTDEENDVLDFINVVLTLCFALEMVIKLWGLGLREYLSDAFNVFDGAIVLATLLELIIVPPSFLTSDDGDSANGGAISALRTFRLFRVFALARQWRSLRVLLETIAETLNDVAYFAVLLLLFMYIFALIGMQFFANRFCFDPDTGLPSEVGWRTGSCPQPLENPRANFDSILESFVTVFQILTGENWNTVMYDGWRAVGWPAAIYFIILFILGNFVVLNLFLAILLGNFESMEELEQLSEEEELTAEEEKRLAAMEELERAGRIPRGASNLAAPTKGARLLGPLTSAEGPSHPKGAPPAIIRLRTRAPRALDTTDAEDLHSPGAAIRAVQTQVRGLLQAALASNISILDDEADPDGAPDTEPAAESSHSEFGSGSGEGGHKHHAPAKTRWGFLSFSNQARVAPDEQQVPPAPRSEDEEDVEGGPHGAPPPPIQVEDRDDGSGAGARTPAGSSSGEVGTEHLRSSATAKIPASVTSPGDRSGGDGGDGDGDGSGDGSGDGERSTGTSASSKGAVAVAPPPVPQRNRSRLPPLRLEPVKSQGSDVGTQLTDDESSQHRSSVQGPDATVVGDQHAVGVDPHHSLSDRGIVASSPKGMDQIPDGSGRPLDVGGADGGGEEGGAGEMKESDGDASGAASGRGTSSAVAQQEPHIMATPMPPADVAANRREAHRKTFANRLFLDSTDSSSTVSHTGSTTSDDLELERKLGIRRRLKLHGHSLCIWGKRHPTRKWLSRIVQSKRFDYVIISIIVVSAIFLAIDSPLNDPNSDFATFLYICDIIFTVLFTIEAMLKIFVFGFLLHRNAYLRSGWNVLDFFIVIISILSLAATADGGSSPILRAMRSLRALRALRPLRVVSRLETMQVVVNALFSSLAAILNVVFICLLFFLIFGIIGVSYFKGTFNACGGALFDEAASVKVSEMDPRIDLVTYPLQWNDISTSHQSFFSTDVAKEYSNLYGGDGDDIPTSKYVCDALARSGVTFADELNKLQDLVLENTTAAEEKYGDGAGDLEGLVEHASTLATGARAADLEWSPVVPSTFDNIIRATTTLFEMSTTEGWADVMFAGVDARGIEMQPVRDQGPYWVFYFIAFMVVGSLFVTNLFVGVVIEHFNRMRERLGDGLFLTPEQREWQRMYKRMMLFRPKRTQPRSENAFVRSCQNLVNDPRFEPVIMACIILNTIVMAMTFFGMEEDYALALEIINLIFAGIFTLEAACKLVAFGIRGYFTDNWNIFDFLVVLGTDVGIILHYSTSIRIGPVATVVRTFRVGRVFRLGKRARMLKRLFETFIMTLPQFVNIGLLLLLLLFIYAILGVQLFATVAWGDTINAHANFQTFGNAMLLLMRFATGEAWNSLMYEAASSTPGCVNDYSKVSASERAKLCGFEGSTSDDPPECIPPNGCGSAAAFPYFITFTLVVTFIFLNLFIAVILERFDLSGSEDGGDGEGSVDGTNLSDEHLEHLKEKWLLFDPEATLEIDADQLVDLLRTLRPPLGFSNQADAPETTLLLRAARLNVPMRAGRRVHFADVSEALAKRVFELKAEKEGRRFEVPENKRLKKRWEETFGTQGGDREPFDIDNYYAARIIERMLERALFRRRLRKMTAESRSMNAAAAAAAAASKASEDPPPTESFKSSAASSSHHSSSNPSKKDGEGEGEGGGGAIEMTAVKKSEDGGGAESVGENHPALISATAVEVEEESDKGKEGE